MHRLSLRTALFSLLMLTLLVAARPAVRAQDARARPIPATAAPYDPVAVPAGPDAPLGLTFTVNSTADQADSSPGNGVCETANGSGVCTLRAAVMETNALFGTDTIIVPYGVYHLDRAGTNEDHARTGDLDIHDHLTIVGRPRGTEYPIIHADSAMANERAFHVIDRSPPLTVLLRYLTLPDSN